MKSNLMFVWKIAVNKEQIKKRKKDLAQKSYQLLAKSERVCLCVNSRNLWKSLKFQLALKINVERWSKRKTKQVSHTSIISYFKKKPVLRNKKLNKWIKVWTALDIRLVSWPKWTTPSYILLYHTSHTWNLVLFLNRFLKYQ